MGGFHPILLLTVFRRCNYDWQQCKIQSAVEICTSELLKVGTVSLRDQKINLALKSERFHLNKSLKQSQKTNRALPKYLPEAEVKSANEWSTLTLPQEPCFQLVHGRTLHSFMPAGFGVCAQCFSSTTVCCSGLTKTHSTSRYCVPSFSPHDTEHYRIRTTDNKQAISRWCTVYTLGAVEATTTTTTTADSGG